MIVVKRAIALDEQMAHGILDTPLVKSSHMVEYLELRQTTLGHKKEVLYELLPLTS